MCLAVPGKIEAISENEHMKMAKVNFDGIKKEVCIEWIPEVEIGDYVIVHAGFAINKLNEVEALKTLDLLQQVKQAPDNLTQLDSKASRID